MSSSRNTPSGDKWKEHSDNVTKTVCPKGSFLLGIWQGDESTQTDGGLLKKSHLDKYSKIVTTNEVQIVISSEDGR